MIQGQETRFHQSCSRATAESATKRDARFRSTERARQSESNPRQIFDRLFQEDKSGSPESRHRKLNHEKRMVDLVLDDSKSLQRRLGD